MAKQSALFAALPAPTEWGSLDWSERWLRWWYEDVATPLQRERYNDLLPVLKELRGVTGKCLSCANEARRIAARGGAG